MADGVQWRAEADLLLLGAGDLLVAHPGELRPDPTLLSKPSECPFGQYSVQIYIVTENDPTNPEALDHRSNRPSLRVRMRTHY
jgi:hypothetical protein